MRPEHYKTGGIEPFEYMKSKMTPEMYEGFLLGNVIKYVSRYKEKNGLDDLKKAQTYLQWLVEVNEENREQEPKQLSFYDYAREKWFVPCKTCKGPIYEGGNCSNAHNHPTEPLPQSRMFNGESHYFVNGKWITASEWINSINVNKNNQNAQ